MTRYFYALSDDFTGHYPKNYDAGFCNTKTAIAFTSKKLRDEWVCETRFLEAQPLTRKQALEYAHGIEHLDNFVILKESEYGYRAGLALVK
jgi:hypothetical protein